MSRAKHWAEGKPKDFTGTKMMARVTPDGGVEFVSDHGIVKGDHRDAARLAGWLKETFEETSED